jgi:hypothetical protein
MTSSGLHLRVKALEHRVANRPQSPKARVPAWLIEDFVAQGVPLDASSGLPDWKRAPEIGAALPSCAWRSRI